MYTVSINNVKTDFSAVGPNPVTWVIGQPYSGPCGFETDINIHLHTKTSDILPKTDKSVDFFDRGRPSKKYKNYMYCYANKL